MRGCGVSLSVVSLWNALMGFRRGVLRINLPSLSRSYVRHGFHRSNQRTILKVPLFSAKPRFMTGNGRQKLHTLRDSACHFGTQWMGP